MADQVERSPYYRNTPTMEEVLPWVAAIDEQRHDLIERKAGIITLNQHIKPLLGFCSFYMANGAEFYESFPNIIRPETVYDPSIPLHGYFQGFFDMDIGNNPDEGAVLDESSRKLCARINQGIGHFDNGFTAGTFEMNVHVPVTGLRRIVAFNELSSLVSNPETVISLEQDYSKVRDTLLEVIENIRKSLKTEIDLQIGSTAKIEKWDSEKESGVTLQMMRQIPLSISAERAEIFVTDSSRHVSVQPVKDLKFTGLYCGVVGLRKGQKHGKYRLVFECHSVEAEDSTGPVMVYVPISDQVELTIEPAMSFEN